MSRTIELPDAVYAALFARFQILSFTEAAIVRYEGLRAAHRHIGKNDLRIAAIALAQSEGLTALSPGQRPGFSAKIEIPSLKGWDVAGSIPNIAFIPLDLVAA
jgi:hypothetical protein